jgi:hypothetical protein
MRETLTQVAQQCDQNLISMSFMTNTNDTLNQNLDEFDQLFMYT